MPMSLDEVRADFAAWARDNLPPLPVSMTKTDRVIDVVRAYAELAYGWDPTKEDDYMDFYAAIYAIVEEPRK